MSGSEIKYSPPSKSTAHPAASLAMNEKVCGVLWLRLTQNATATPTASAYVQNVRCEVTPRDTRRDKHAGACFHIVGFAAHFYLELTCSLDSGCRVYIASGVPTKRGRTDYHVLIAGCRVVAAGGRARERRRGCKRGWGSVGRRREYALL